MLISGSIWAVLALSRAASAIRLPTEYPGQGTTPRFDAGLLAGSLEDLERRASTASDQCSPSDPCPLGCCGNGGNANNPYFCGMGPTFCGEGNCTSSCDSKADCNPGDWPPQYYTAATCPLNVCCSQYGFCGTTSDFCGDTTVPQPSCSADSYSTQGRRIAYYEGWSTTRPCDLMLPSSIPLGLWTHVNMAFASIDPDSFAVSVMAGVTDDTLQQIAGLKAADPSLKVFISVGGWSFNDPGPTQTTFSTLAGSSSAQQNFFASLISFMSTYNLDGVDIDWEYPVASDRGGNADDYANYPSFLQNLRDAMNDSGFDFGLTATAPSSYWYLQHFDIVKMSQTLDWFNVMTYDLHGTWDATDDIGNIALAHTNLTEIMQTMDLFWRNNIDPSKITLGIGFYGRSFTMESSSCMETGCPFSGAGNPGPCTQSAGTLSAEEIRSVIAAGATVTLDPVAAVEIVTWDNNQWVSYDDLPTFKMKMDYANSVCLGGVMVWAVDLDDTANATSTNELASAMNLPANSTIMPTTGNITGLDLDSGLIGS